MAQLFGYGYFCHDPNLITRCRSVFELHWAYFFINAIKHRGLQFSITGQYRYVGRHQISQTDERLQTLRCGYLSSLFCNSATSDRRGDTSRVKIYRMMYDGQARNAHTLRWTKGSRTITGRGFTMLQNKLCFRSDLKTFSQQYWWASRLRSQWRWITAGPPTPSATL
eukprot:TRINITY_DN5885_c0_g1_i1.p1 TRINITY_DN5885_c0_g1~~TRINITY_DN5885_c0_g1_i1.p1  ORF type:complete len:167 (+),score=1.17 TRINITY_DN5885_c0_g1_i1:3-503(+)